ncbi:SCO6745 family protein [Streptomyces goshikiensis]|uniref:SCO6745 family protein n=1 Tax=Streptomyces goshikiensis TaxID=1942 RepID=UPI00371CCA5A
MTPNATVHDGAPGLGAVRQLWQLLEPVHAVVYFAPESYEEAAALGYATDDRWPLYFAFRAAPLGAAGPELVTSLFYSFSPSMVERYVSRLWETAPPAAVLAARAAATDRALRALLGERVASPDLAEAAALARRAAEAAATAGRPLAAANSAQPWPETPHAVLWQAATILREHRGDGHLAALQAHRLDPVESLVLHSAAGAAPAEVFESRQWSPGRWSAGRDRLASRGLLAGDGAATGAGLALRTSAEKLTDELAAAPWSALSPQEVTRLTGLLLAPVLDIVAAGLLPHQSTLGIGMKYDYQPS